MADPAPGRTTPADWTGTATIVGTGIGAGTGTDSFGEKPQLAILAGSSTVFGSTDAEQAAWPVAEMLNGLFGTA